LSVSLI